MPEEGVGALACCARFQADASPSGPSAHAEPEPHLAGGSAGGTCAAAFAKGDSRSCAQFLALSRVPR
eukprot:14358847-Alexandrium_andersonii.AAC.1